MSVDLAALQPLLVELNDLKRIHTAGRVGTIASRLFGEAWVALIEGGTSSHVARTVTARAVAAARLGDIDAAVLSEAGVPPEAVAVILRDSLAASAAALPASLRADLAEVVAEAPIAATRSSPSFVRALDDQPRAGITCPGKPRILLEPPESHAEHCLVVAVYSVLLAPRYGADPARVFLAALSHHFHNATLPDSGFTGEMLLGPHLARVMAHGTARCLAELDPSLRARVEDARLILPGAATPEGRAFHAADAIDRVLQVSQYSRAASLTPARVLGEMELVHAGPTKDFQDDVLREAGLL